MTREEQLIEAALEARRWAVAPYSGFAVGAALFAESGKIYTGCNIENSSYGLTLCAERLAVFKAVSEGERTFHLLCLVADTKDLVPPCGACRQIIWEFCGDVPVLLANLENKKRTVQASDLLPEPFDGRLLES